MSFYVLIDYENVSNPIDFVLNTEQENKEQEDKKVKLFFFIGPSQPTPQLSYRNKLYDSFGKENVDFVQVHDRGDNALDFVLSGYLGLYAGRDPEGQYWIVSGDQGFDPLISHFKGDLKLDVQRAFNIRDLVNKLSPVIKLDGEEPEHSPAPLLSALDILKKNYIHHLFLFLRNSDTNVRYWKRSRQEVEADLVKNIPNYWTSNPELACDLVELPTIINATLEHFMKHKFITEDEEGKLCYFVKNELLIEPTKYHVLEHRPINRTKLVNTLMHFGKICKQDDPSLFCERMLKELQESKTCWIKGESVSYNSEEEAINLSLKYSFFKFIPSKLKENPPRLMSELKEWLRSEGESYQITEEDIFNFIHRLIKSNQLRYNGDDLTWTFTSYAASRPSSFTKPNKFPYSQPSPRYSNTQYDSRYYWEKTLYYIQLPNRPSTLYKLKSFLFNNFKTTESHIDSIVMRLQKEGYLTVLNSPTGDKILNYR